MMVEISKEFPELAERAAAASITDVSAGEYYGKYYQDIQIRVPAIKAAAEQLGWAPSTNLRDAVRKTIAYYVDLERKTKGGGAA